MNNNKYQQALYNNEMYEILDVNQDYLCEIIRSQYSYHYIELFKCNIEENKRFFNQC